MKRTVEALTDGTLDVLILGGGITGAGVALDAALRGWRVGLIDKGDFASGTSSVSSKLIHGGLRYLEHGAFHLVYEALHERGLLLRNAPHLVWPLRFFMPFYRGGRLPPWQCRLGMTLYDFLAGRHNIRRSRPVDVNRLTRACRQLKPDGLLGGAEYADAQMDDARLCIEVLMTAAACGAHLANYVEVIAFDNSAGQALLPVLRNAPVSTPLHTVRVVDRITGSEATIRARLVLNATGPWVDHICRLAGDDATGPYLQPTKGVHVVLPNQGLPAGLLLLHPADGRVFFVLPWLGKTLVGTTDTFTSAGPDALTVEPEDVAYLLEGYNHHFQPAIAAGDVLGSFAGLRPLLAGSAKPSSLSREFRVWQSRSGLLSVAGGKFTTFRHMAEVITDNIGRLLGKRQRCRTRNYPLVGAPDTPWHEYLSGLVTNLCQRCALPAATAEHLARRYGRRALVVAEYLDASPGNREALCHGELDLRAEIPYQREHEMALFDADHWLRRTRLGLFGRSPAPRGDS
jgi:glycerol-3-phosphate dehydrogenase